MSTGEGDDVKAMKASLRTWWKGFAKKKSEGELIRVGLSE